MIMNNNNWLSIELTQEQEFKLEEIKRIMPRMSRVKLEELAYEALRIRYGYQNAFTSMVKDK